MSKKAAGVESVVAKAAPAAKTRASAAANDAAAAAAKLAASGTAKTREAAAVVGENVRKALIGAALTAGSAIAAKQK